MLEEMGLPYEVVPVKFPPAARDPDYLKINPLGTLPTLIDGAATIFESVGIVDYLARRYGPTPLAPPPEEAGFADYLQFLHLGEAGLSGPLTYLLHARFFAPEDAKANWSLDDIRKTFAQRLRLVTDQLARKPYMAGGAFTAADISVGYALLMGRWISADEAYDERLNDYLERITARDAHLRAMAA
jgi:glutathione S-transferase